MLMELQKLFRLKRKGLLTKYTYKIEENRIYEKYYGKLKR